MAIKDLIGPGFVGTTTIKWIVTRGLSIGEAAQDISALTVANMAGREELVISQTTSGNLKLSVPTGTYRGRTEPGSTVVTALYTFSIGTRQIAIIEVNGDIKALVF